MKEIYVHMSDDVDVEQRVAVRFEALRRIGAKSISCGAHAEGLLEKSSNFVSRHLTFATYDVGLNRKEHDDG